MIDKNFLFNLAAGLALALVLTPATAAELRSIELSATPDTALITLALTDGAAPKVFTLDHPDRAVIDLPGTHADHGIALPGAAGLVTGVRLGRQPGGTLRVVVQLKSPVAVHSTATAGSGGR